MSDIFNELFDAGDLERAMVDTLQTWFPTYLRAIELRKTLPPRTLPNPRSYEIMQEVNTFDEDQVPAVLVVSPGLAGQPRKHGDGKLSAWWAVGVGVVVSALDKRNTNDVTKIYALAVRTLVLQQSSLGGIANAIVWEDESYDETPQDAERTLGVAVVGFSVEVTDVIDSRAGPREPLPPDPEDELPGSQWPTANDVIIDIEKVNEIDEEG